MDTNNKKKKIEYGFLIVLFLLLSGAYLFLKWNEQTKIQLLLSVLMLLFGYLAAISDAKTQRIPNKLVLIMLACWMIVVIPQLIIAPDNAYNLVMTGLTGFVAGGGITMFAYLASRKGLGGCYIGATAVLSGILFGSILALLVNAVLMIARKRKKTDRFAFVPYINVGIVMLLFLS